MTGRESCYACPLGCKKIAEVTDSEKYKNEKRYGSPEYETIAAFGSNCGIDDPRVIIKANELCNKYGMDTISTGVVISFVMECFEKGILTKEKVDGMDIHFGNASELIKLISKIANRQGVGDMLAEGVKRAAEKIGNNTERYAVHVKGEEVAMQEPRGKAGCGLGYAVSPQGGDHIQMEFDWLFEKETKFLKSLRPLGVLDPVPATDLGNRKVYLFTYNQKIWSFYNVLDLCIFVGVPGHTFGIDHITKIIKAVTGWDTSEVELLKVGERGLTLCGAFNVREGFTHEDDWLPPRLLEPIEGGAMDGQKISENELEKAIKSYYFLMGWDEKDIPTPVNLAQLEIGWVDDLL